MDSSCFEDIICPDCDETFTSASQILTHFALHAHQRQYYDILNEIKNDRMQNIQTFKSSVLNKNLIKNIKNNVPDLYPINVIKSKLKHKNIKIKVEIPMEGIKSPKNHHLCDIENVKYLKLNGQKGVEDDFSPLRFCSVTMDESKLNLLENSLKLDIKESSKSKFSVNVTKKKYSCTICLKVFGWSTDLKRHLLTHTGERPFKCNVCDANFTRNFLLQKHISKVHSNSGMKYANIIPKLKPICNIKYKHCKNKTKKQFDNTSYGKNVHQIHNLSLIDKGTVVQ